MLVKIYSGQNYISFIFIFTYLLLQIISILFKNNFKRQGCQQTRSNTSIWTCAFAQIMNESPVFTLLSDSFSAYVTMNS